MVRTRTVLLASIALVGLVLSAPAAASADAEFSVTSPAAQDAPDRSVSFQGSTVEFGSVLPVQAGDTEEVSVDAPAGEGYDVYLYDSDRQIERILGTGEGPETFTADFAGLETGTYAVLVFHDGSFVAAMPVVVQGYDVTAELEAVDEYTDDGVPVVAGGESVDVGGSVAPTLASEAPEVTTVAVWDGNAVQQVAVDVGGSGGYDVSVDAGDLDPGTYTVVAGARTGDTFQGQRELAGVSDPVEFAVLEGEGDDEESTGEDEESDGEASESPENEGAGPAAQQGDVLTPDGDDETPAEGPTGAVVLLGLGLAGVGLVRRVR